MSQKLRISFSRLLLIGLVCAMPASLASAGPLLSAPNIFNNGAGPGPGGAWVGSTAFVTGTLQGYVDWAVFGPAQFPYPGTGYSPTSGELTYVYQVYETGTAPLSSFSMALTDLADNIGAFSGITGDVPSSMSLTPLPSSSATWRFAGIAQGGNSEGLAFSSIRVPQNLLGTVVDTGQSTTVIPLPSPSPTSIPEPATVGMALLVGLTLLARRRSV